MICASTSSHDGVRPLKNTWLNSIETLAADRGHDDRYEPADCTRATARRGGPEQEESDRHEQQDVAGEVGT